MENTSRCTIAKRKESLKKSQLLQEELHRWMRELTFHSDSGLEIIFLFLGLKRSNTWTFTIRHIRLLYTKYIYLRWILVCDIFILLTHSVSIAGARDDYHCLF